MALWFHVERWGGGREQASEGVVPVGSSSVWALSEHVVVSSSSDGVIDRSRVVVTVAEVVAVTSSPS